MGIGIYGKHPGFGDFVAGGLSDPMRARIEGWVGSFLPALRTMWAADWEVLYDAAPPLRLWFGPDLTKAGTFTGCLIPSRDKVGRRYPLIAGTEAVAVLPPVLDTDQRLYEAVEDAVAAYQRPAGTAAEGLVAALVDVLGHPEPEVLPQRSFWATRPGADVAALWSDVAAADHVGLAGGRSYVWVRGAPGGQSGLHVADRLPTVQEIAWLWSGLTQDQLATAEEPASVTTEISLTESQHTEAGAETPVEGPQT